MSQATILGYMMTSQFAIMFWLLASHAVCDYALQNDFVAQAKNPNTPLGKDIWPWVLGSHALIHGGGVALVTGMPLLGVAETVAHGLIDFLKCKGRLSFHQDQALHVACKLVWFVIAVEAVYA